MKFFSTAMAKIMLLFILAQAAACSESNPPMEPGVRACPLGKDGSVTRKADHKTVHRVVLTAYKEHADQTKDIQATDIFQEGVNPSASFQHDGADVWQCEPDTNYEGDDLWIFGRHDGVYAPCFGWPYMKFDMTGKVPDGAIILQAVLSMHLDSAYGNYQTAVSHKVLSSWNESSLTYNSAPPDWNNGQYESEVYITSANRWWEWDITQMTTDWAADPSSNFGVAILPIDSLYDDDVMYWSSDDCPVTSQRPKLTVDYLLPEHRASFVDQVPPPPSMYLQQTAEVSLRFQNDGADEWDQAGGYHMGSQSPADNNTWGLSRVDLPSSVGPGGLAIFDFQVTAPDSPGTYVFQWQMKDDAVGWFGQLSDPVNVTVNKKPLSTTCQTGSECSSGNCVDGYCCDGFCAGTCQSCALPGFEGNCRYIPPGQDPDEECAGSGICGSYCDGTGQCVFPAMGTRCADCASCDGAGNCNQFEPAGTDPADRCGLCRVCPGDGPDCVAAAPDTDPMDECQHFSPDTCGQTGNCTGDGSCQLYPADTVCGPETCTAGVHHPADLCDGAGQCIISQDENCAPYICLDSVSCRTDCQDDSQCSGESYCQQGSCAAYIHLGDGCEHDAECITGHCVDGVCCESPCDGSCQACNLEPNPGTCTWVPSGQDPREDCPGEGVCKGVCDGQGQCVFAPVTTRCDTCTSCDGAGFCTKLVEEMQDPFDDCSPCFACSGQVSSCVAVAYGQDPLDDCPPSPRESCGTTGQCDGNGACELYPADTICKPASCSDGILEPADVCDGLGSCFDRGQLSCQPYICQSQDSCAESCEDDTECAEGFHCEEQSCVQDLPDAETCTRDGQCQNGHCVDGVCCTSPCDALCERCDLQGSVGTCSAISAGQDPDAECEGDGQCGGSCDGHGQCQLPGEDTVCAPCARCDGQGSCSVFIGAGLDPDDRCGPCRVCSGNTGQCVSVEAGADPFDECEEQDPSTCGTDGSCDGDGACRLWSTQTLCGEQSCLAGVLHRAPACDGQGQCEDQGDQDCAPYTCDGINCAGPDQLFRISIEDLPDGTGQAIVDKTLTTDDTLELYAVGRDAQDQALGPVVVTWNLQGGIGMLRPGPSSRAVLDPTTVGAGKITASFHDADVQQGQTGDIVVTAGLAAGEFLLEANPVMIPPDGQSTSLITGGPVLDADNNPVSTGTMVTVLSSAGDIMSEDMDQVDPGVQRSTDDDGFFSFTVRAPVAPGQARLLAETLAPDHATAEGLLYFSDGHPMADAGPDKVVISGQHVTLDGSASFDPTNRMLVYQWSQTSGDTVEIAGQDTPLLEFTAPLVEGSADLQFQLIVTAGQDQSAPDTVTVTVIGMEQDLPTAIMTLDPDTGTAPLDVNLDASQSHAADCCELLAYNWWIADGTQMQGQSVQHSFEKPGSMGVELMVTDDQGAFSFAQGQVVVTDGDKSPPSLMATATPPRGRAPLYVNFFAQASDTDGNVELIEWNMGGGFVLKGPEQHHLFSQPGLYQVRVRATDDTGLTAEQTLHIAVSDDGIYPPKIISTPATSADAGRPWIYTPRAMGTQPLVWSLGKHLGEEVIGAPVGMEMHPDTGELTWTPSDSQAGQVDITIVVKNDAGNDFQDFQVEVTGSTVQSGCGCGHASKGDDKAKLWLLLAFVLFAMKPSGQH